MSVAALWSEIAESLCRGAPHLLEVPLKERGKKERKVQKARKTRKKEEKKLWIFAVGGGATDLLRQAAPHFQLLPTLYIDVFFENLTTSFCLDCCINGLIATFSMELIAHTKVEAAANYSKTLQ